MYISDYSKKHVISDYIEYSLGKKVEIKNIYKRTNRSKPIRNKK